MSGASSNAAEIEAKLKALVESVDFTKAGAQQSLGRDCLAEVTQNILAETIGDQKSPDGKKLTANRGKYGKRKKSRGLPVGIGLRAKAKLATGGKSNDAGRMLSEVEVAGEQDISAAEASMKYGRTERARLKSQWFTNGGSPGIGQSSGTVDQPPRPFYGLSPGSIGRVMVVCKDYVRDLIRKF